MFKGIAHAAFRVSNLEAALDFYCKGLGLREAFRMNNPQTGKLWIVYLQLAPGQFVELFPVDAAAPLAGGDRYLHLCLEVFDLEAAVQSLQDRGVTITRGISRGLDGNLQAWVRDPDGNDIELMQIASDSLQSQADKAWQA